MAANPQKTALPLTRNTDPAFNGDYLKTPEQDFLGLLMVELDRDDGRYFCWMNVAIYPRIREALGPSCLCELTPEQRVEDHAIEFDQDSGVVRHFQIFQRWAFGKCTINDL